MKSDPGFAVPRYCSKGIRTASPICGFWRLRKTRSFNRVHRAKADYRIDLKAIRRRKAVAAMAGLVGALSLARAVGDPALSDEIIAAREVRAVGGGAAVEHYSLPRPGPLFPKRS